MKVYELMQKLSEMQAGAEVYISGAMTDKELHQCGVYDVCEGEEMFSVTKEIETVEEAEAGLVYLYF